MTNVHLVGGPLDGSVTWGDEAIGRGDRLLIVELDDGRMGAYTCASAAGSRRAKGDTALRAVWSGPL